MMAENTKIDWCDHTHSPWVGCTKVSPACKNCYAEGWAKRAGRDVWGPHAERQKTKTRSNLYKWNKALEGTGKQESIFPSLCDPFDDHKSIQQEWRNEYWNDILQCKNLIFMLLTKRPENIKKTLPEFWEEIKDRVWLGITAENQDEAEGRIPHLLRHGCAVRFLSCEPLLSELSLEEIPMDDTGELPANALSGIGNVWDGNQLIQAFIGGKIDWVIAGCESGSKRRATNIGWFEYLATDCNLNMVPFFMKQMEIDGKVTTDISKFPKILQVREFPEVGKV